MEKQIPLRLLFYQWVLLQERCMWFSVPCHPCFGSPALEFYSSGNVSPVEIMLRKSQCSGAEENPHPFTSNKQNPVVKTRIYLQPSNTKWISKDNFFLFYCFTETVRTDIPGYVTPGFVLQLRVPTHRSLPTPAWQFFLWALGLEPWQISEQNSNFSALWFPQCSLMHLHPSRLWTFHIPFCRNGYFGAGLELEQTEKAQQNTVFIKAFNELTVQVNCIYHKHEILQ